MSKIWLFGEITDPSAEAVCREIWQSEGAPRIVMNSPGGLVSAAFAIYDAIMAQPWSCVTATGLCGSAANIVLQAAGIRLATPNTQFSFHNVASSHWDTGAYLDGRLRYVVSSRIGDTNFVGARRASVFGVDAAIALGLIDGEES